jgi:beta-D-xylosidase 4
MPIMMKTMMATTLVLHASASLPNGHAWGCLPNNVSAHLPFCDSKLSTDERLTDLISRLTLEEKIGLLSADKNTGVSVCNMMGHGVQRLGIPPYMHLVETNTAVASTCLGPLKCAQNYPGPTGLGATFNRSLWYKKGEAMGDEMRAFNNLNWYRATGDAPKSLIGLNGYGPNLNIARDPRYGRTSELPGEDAYLTGQYAINMVRGGQGQDDYQSGKSKYLKMTLGLKHYALYGVEVDRPSFIPNVTAHDLWESYLPQYSSGFSKVDLDGKPAGNAMGTMCSYAGLNGVPSCANDYLLNKVIRSKFEREDVVVGTDCGAINNMFQANHYAENAEDAAAKSLNGGADMELGDQVWAPVANGGSGLLEKAVDDKKTTEDRVNESVRRVLNLRMITGQFDSIDDQPYTKINSEAVNSTFSHELNLEAALQSFVLLKNVNNVLPMDRNKKTVLVGPHVHSTRDLMSDYKGDQQCYDGGYNCFPTIAEEFTSQSPSTTFVQQGVEMNSTNSSGIAAAMSAIQNHAEQVLIFIGIGNNEEHEAHDRFNTSLPGLQEPFTLNVLSLCRKLNIPAAVVMINGGAVAIDPVVPAAEAIVEAFYPSVRGAKALNMALFGDSNRFGRLSVTLYNKDYINQVDFHNFDLSIAPGRTYKYYTGKPLFHFGEGMSYSTFDMNCDVDDHRIDTNSNTKITCTITNMNGSPEGDEVLMVYHQVSDSIRKAAKHPVPIRELVDFDRVTVQKGGTVAVHFNIGENQLGLVDENGDRQLIAGVHTIFISNGSNNQASFRIVIKENKVLDVVPRF